MRDAAAYAVYSTATRIASPFLAAWLWSRTRHRALLQRFAPPVPDLDVRPIWIHACSVGEVNSAKPLIDALHVQWPDVPQVLSVSTPSAYQQSGGLATPWLHITRLPFDTPRAVRQFVQKLTPRMLVLMETELWPCLIHETRRLGTPVILVSGRLSAKHILRYRRIKALIRPLFSDMAALAVQTPLYAERFQMLGADPARVHVTGSTKYDGVVTEVDGVDLFRHQLGYAPDDQVLVFGSTRPGDEALAYVCWNQLKPEFPTLRLVVAPRHVQRLDDVVRNLGGSVRRWSTNADSTAPEKPLVVDTMGDLVTFYALATVAVVGGSFFPGVEGHNPFEPAGLGVPTVFGPYMANFAEPAALLLEANGAVQLASPDELTATLRVLLGAPGRRTGLGSAARAVVLANRGAIAKTVELIAKHLQA